MSAIINTLFLQSVYFFVVLSCKKWLRYAILRNVEWVFRSAAELLFHIFSCTSMRNMSAFERVLLFLIMLRRRREAALSGLLRVQTASTLRRQEVMTVILKNR